MRTLLTTLLLMTCFPLSAGPPMAVGGWTSVPVFDELPLEAKLGLFQHIPDPDVVSLILWNDGVTNRLDAVSIPFPHDGAGITSTPLDSSGVLFSLGDICTEGNVVLAPYIDNFNVEYARFNGSSWGTLSIPFTLGDDFDSADCAANGDGIFVSAHNDTNDTLVLYRSVNGGINWSIYDTILAGGGNTISGPFDGAVRDQLAISPDGEAASLFQLDDGRIRVSTFNTADNPPTLTNTDVANLPPPAGFTFVKESGGGIIATLGGKEVRFTYNADGNARTVNVPVDNPGAFSTGNLGTVNNNGMFFTFQAGTLVAVEDGSGQAFETNVLWGDYFVVREPFPTGMVSVDNDFPAQGFGGPVDSCFVQFDGGKSWASRYITAGSNSDTVLRARIGESIFTDGFESGDLSVWRCC